MVIEKSRGLQRKKGKHLKVRQKREVSGDYQGRKRL